jgi:hypothetical protein
MTDALTPVAAPNQQDANRDDASGHNARGQFTLANREARKHGLYSQRIPPELIAACRAFCQQSIVEDGGEGEITIRRRSWHEKRARIELLIDQLYGAIEEHGLFDKRGKLRVAWLQRLEGLIARAASIDAMLGLERRTKRVDSFAAAVAQEPAHD